MKNTKPNKTKTNKTKHFIKQGVGHSANEDEI